MKQEIREQIVSLRLNGYGYKSIANLVGLRREAVRWVCQNEGLTGERAEYKNICVVCGKEFKTNIPQSKYCSEECCKKSYKKKYEANKKEPKVYNFVCEYCGEEFTARRPQKFCSDSCRNKSHNEKRPYISRKVKRIAFCPICGEAFTTDSKSQKYCSNKCSRRANRKRSDPRISDPSRIVDKNISLPALIKRDNNICWLCGEPCDLYDYEIAESGNMYPLDMYPTVDHVIPLSCGGVDSWDNIKLAHRKCNVSRGAKINNVELP